ncbi:hypothetical protein MUN89_15550 [Halobacillus salinarum]|uniref:Lipoprotein n=1 Tax=Halobacillus salinarum TaxID=2932257 RepID=A0ABY4EH57_9BACI|nr:hypothetical protein [Halobacillus salinarum]UOQ43325.1 hypothetical protein MUN89_15550 [Halobacillus salinarum]
MNMRKLVIALFLTSILVSGCKASSNADASDDTNTEEQDSNSSANHEQADEENETSSDSHTDESKDAADSASSDQSNGNETGSSSSDQKNKDDQPINDVKKHTFETTQQAANEMKNYRQVTQTNIDLGHDIKGSSDAGAGHQYISWNEGNWLIELDYPTDPKYAPKKNADNKELAKKIVEYLDTHYLPAPKDKGVIKIRGFKDSPQTLIRWQVDNVIYEIKSSENNPMETIKEAVKAGKDL